MAQGDPPVALDAPTNRPDEPLTSGAALGAGAGRSVLGPPGGMLSELLRDLATRQHVSSEVAALAAYVASGRL